jgi:hypothetical protein
VVADFTIKRNDREPDLVMTLTQNGAPWPIPAGSTAKIIMKLPGAGVPKVDAAVVIDADQGTNPGKVSYAWAAGNTDTEGVYDVEVQVTLSSGETATFPISGYKTIEVTEDLG